MCEAPTTAGISVMEKNRFGREKDGIEREFAGY